MSDHLPDPHPLPSRGPGPTFPEKPPSVAERTRLLHSSFCKEDTEKAKVFEKLDKRVITANLSNQKSNIRGSNGSLNDERSPSPSPAVASSAGRSADSPTSLTGGVSSTKPPPQEKNVPGTAASDSNKDVNGRQAQDGQPVNAAKRDAFFRAGGDGPTTKFDPSNRYVGGHDRERLTKKEDNQAVSHANDMEKEKEKERERKYGAETRKDLEGYVGFANLPNQVYRKSVKRGFEFTLMVVGESGLGKSTLINSLFLSDLYSAEYPGPSHRIQKTVKVDTTQVTLKENGVHLRLTIVDTPGFGDAVDNSNCWSPVTDFIDSKYDEYLNSESRVNRTTSADNRVHCCLYFIAPTGHGLKPLDVEFMKRLHDKVNIIPLIAKADTLTPDECREFKKTILNEIAQHKIRIYEFPDCDDEEEMKVQKKLRDRVPFAVVGSNRVIEVGGKRVRGRQYPWGIVEVENLEHNDFIGLRNMVIRTHMQDLKDVTNNVHYENFRYNKLAPTTAEGKVKPGSLTKDPLTQMAEERQEHNAKMKKMEAEMEQVFEMKVKEKRQKLKDSEADLQKRSEQMKKSLEQQQKELDEKWKEFEKEKAAWEEQWGERRRSLENQKDKKGKKGLF